MRVDKYLWYIRFYKTRMLATEACKKGRVQVNGRCVKASKEVFVGDSIVVRKDSLQLCIEVSDIPKNRLGAKQTGLFKKDNGCIEGKESVLTGGCQRDKGTGRPTKKERRDLDGFTKNVFFIIFIFTLIF